MITSAFLLLLNGLYFETQIFFSTCCEIDCQEGDNQFTTGYIAAPKMNTLASHPQAAGVTGVECRA
jgi:hypothetical protein